MMMIESKRIYPLLIFLAFTSIIDTSLISPILATYAKDLGASESQAGLIVALYSVLVIVLSFPLGYLIDRIGRRKAMLISIPGDILAFLIYMTASSYISLIYARVIHAIFDTMLIPTAIAFIGDQFARRGKPLSVFYTFISLGILTGSGTATIITLRYGFSYVFLPSIIFHIILLAIILNTSFKEVKGAKISDSIKEVRLNLNHLIAAFLTMFSVYMLIGTISGSLGPALAKIFNLTYQQAGASVGIFLAITAIVSIPFFFLASFICENKTPLLGLSIASILGLLTSLIMFQYINLYLYVAGPILGISLAMAYLSSSFIAASVGERGRGTASGMLQIFNLGGVALGASISGYILENWGATYPFILPAFPLVLSIIFSSLIMLVRR